MASISGFRVVGEVPRSCFLTSKSARLAIPKYLAISSGSRRMGVARSDKKGSGDERKF
ncbi:hypothetical protein BDY24DRAFT_397591 [Mrakia frigida]|uniref:uncharacterized protein n=1 Tax=Mrakia frigida TaxID=29902 RepID=UPI003FCC131B